MAAPRRTKRPGWGEVTAVLALMIGLQFAGSLMFPDRWTGAQGPVQILGASVLGAAVYFLVGRALFGSSGARGDSTER